MFYTWVGYFLPSWTTNSLRTSPSLGAYFASRPLPISSTSSQDSWNVYALPAAISLVFLVVETIYLAVKLPETRGWKKVDDQSTTGSTEKATAVESTQSRLDRLKAVGRLHGLFLLFFSGVSDLTILRLYADFRDYRLNSH
jgi:hypothetical protein